MFLSYPNQSLAILKADTLTGVMVCFYLPPLLAKRLAIPGGLPPEELHLTLAYLGDVDELTRPDKLLKDLTIFADNNPALEGNISGVGRFNNPSINPSTGSGYNSGQAEHPFYASFDSPALPGFRQRLVDFLQFNGWPTSDDHGFTPHITLAYLRPDQDNPLTIVEPIYTTFDTLSLTLGGDIYDLPLTGASDKELREAVRVVQMANLIEMGGAGSGNWGHGGRPGKRGGSGKGGGLARIGATREMSVEERRGKSAESKGKGGGAASGQKEGGDKAGGKSFKEADSDAMSKHYDKALQDGCKAGKISCDAITDYAGADYSTINSALRDGDLSDSYTATQVKLLDQSIDNAPRVPDDIVTNRFAGGKPFYNKMNKLEPGDTFLEDAFMSTTIAKDAKLDDIPGASKSAPVSFKINVPKGSKAAYIPSLSEFPDEKELLLPRGSKFKINSKQVKNGVLEIEMTLEE